MDNFKRKYFITTYGCQMNLHESEKIAGMLESEGYEKAASQSEADIIVFNTCCIRENAEDRAEGNIGALKKLKKTNNNLIIAVGGCMTQQNGYAEKLYKEFPFIDIIFGTHNLDDFRSLLSKRIDRNKSVIDVWDKEGDIREDTPKCRSSYPNAWINIVYGCNNFCTYCIVPYVRGRERSRKTEDIVNECKKVISEGYKEITLLGQNVNSYGHDLGTSDFSSLLKEINKIEGKFRKRFMTNHPKDFNEELIKTMSECEKFCKSVHLPVQSGSNRILKLMNRHYSREDYFDKVSLLRKYIPDIAITTDIMVGFPGETEEDFNETMRLISEVGFDASFSFVYSARPGTPAASYKDDTPQDVKLKRLQHLQAVIDAKATEISQSMLGRVERCLVFGKAKKGEGLLSARTDNNRVVNFKGDELLIGQMANIRITEVYPHTLGGELA